MAILLACGLAAGCVGNVADYVGSARGIIAPELNRFGLDGTQSQCVGARLVESLTPIQLRRLQRLSATVREGYYEPGRLVIRDLLHVATTMGDPQIRLELSRALDGCQVATEPAPPPTIATQATVPEAQPAEWLNLGAAPTGQQIAVDAATLEREPNSRKAWFRLTNPNQQAATGISYLLRIDCQARTIEALAHRREDATGAVTELQEYSRDAEGPLPVEGGTVMEIAFLALCT
ncbi:MAG: hypothetical protein ACT4OE_02715 [Sphingosinicella sp.]